MIGDEVHAAVRLMPDWLPRQRWFAGRARPIAQVRPVSATLINDHGPRVWHVLVQVTTDGSGEAPSDATVYQVPVSIHDDHVPRLDHALIGDIGSSHAYDALHDPDAVSALLLCFRDGATVGDLTFHVLPDVIVPSDDRPLVMPVEQSNTSVAIGDAALLKVYRRVHPGMNPDIEVHNALSRAGSHEVAPLLGWSDGSWTAGDGDATTGSLAMLQEYLTTASDGWALASASVRDLYAEGDLHASEAGGDFAAEAQRLGEATGAVHALLAAVLPTSTLTVDGLNELADLMLRRLHDAEQTVPEVAPFAPSLRARLELVRTVATPVPAQRVHGDLHLGQVLRTSMGWKLIDFEGEPARPIAERTILDSPLRDVAGMLRSFDYAARYLAITDYPADDPAHDQIGYRASEWTQRNRDAFCKGYAQSTGSDPREQPVLLDAYEIDKAVYEAAYEARYRPAWLPIPLAAIERLAALSGD